jgi:hypothetical protein
MIDVSEPAGRFMAGQVIELIQDAPGSSTMMPPRQR